LSAGFSRPNIASTSLCLSDVRSLNGSSGRVATLTVGILVSTIICVIIGWFQLRKKERPAGNAVTQSPIIITINTVISSQTINLTFEHQKMNSVVGETKPTITHPSFRDEVDSPITVGGTHHNEAGNYWLITNDGNQYWPKHEVKFGPGGQWEERIFSGGGHPVTISLINVSGSVHTTFENWKRNANKTKNWDALILDQTTVKENVVRCDSVVVTVPRASQQTA
jgi:hypothetical protein